MTSTEPVEAVLNRWRAAVSAARDELSGVPETLARRRPAPGKWSAAELIGHLIDSATNNHRRFVMAQLQDDLVFPGYAQDDWVRVQRYQQAGWPALVDLWTALNARLLAVVADIGPDDLARPRPVHNLDQLAWQPVEAGEPVTLGWFVADYVGHLEHHLVQVRRLVRAQPDGSD